MTGDSIVQRRLLTRNDASLRPLFDLIRGADVAFTRLEVLPNDFVGDPALESGGSHFGAPAWVLDELTDAGFDLFAMANNDSLDYGISGLLPGDREARGFKPRSSRPRTGPRRPSLTAPVADPRLAATNRRQNARGGPNTIEFSPPYTAVSRGLHTV